jgi:hypothetical protein
MVDSMNCAAPDLVRDSLDATIVLDQDMPSLLCAVRDLRESQIATDRCKPRLAASRRPTRPILRPASTHPMESTIWP